jgi:hypothetical protein
VVDLLRNSGFRNVGFATTIQFHNLCRQEALQLSDVSIMSAPSTAASGLEAVSPPAVDDDKEKKRRKQAKRMSKILGTAWQESDAVFQDADASTQSNNSQGAVYCLTDIGEKLDQKLYTAGKHGWEDFCKDLGGVYNRHIKKYVFF